MDFATGRRLPLRGASPPVAGTIRWSRALEWLRQLYSASMRSGRTKTTSFSLDDITLKNLKALAARRHNGNVSALLAGVATREAKFTAAEAYFDKYGVPPLTAEAIERIEAEWQGVASPKKRRRKAA